ncbi:MAG: hypothetical protein KA445_02355 [Sediminibacterium sp.]|nr:hypothetical protein [Sediminibacterium sp.]
MERKIKLFLFIFFGSFVFLSSCKKETTAVYLNNNNTSADQIKLLIGQVKNWHDSIVQVKSTPSTDSKIKSFSFSEASEDLNIKEIDWSAAYLNYDTIGKKGISVPLWIDASTGLYLQLVSSIVNGKVNGYIVKTLPTPFYHKMHKDIYDFTYFSGTVSVYNLTGKFINKVEFEEGEPVNQNKLKNNQVSVATMADLQEVTVIGYRHMPNYIALMPIESCPTCGPEPEDTNGGGGNGIIFIGGNEAAATAPKIENLVKDPCLANIVQKIIEKDLANAMSQRLLSIFDKSETMNLYFIESSVNDRPGNFRVTYPKSGISNYTIYLDLTRMPIASNEYKAAVIIHEITHAIIRSNLTSDENKAMLDTEKHYNMLQNYVQEMKDFLQETFTLNDQEALSMIFSGIGDLNNENNSTSVNAGWENNFKKIISSHGFSLIYGDANYYLNEIDLFKSGIKGTKNCN